VSSSAPPRRGPSFHIWLLSCLSHFFGSFSFVSLILPRFFQICGCYFACFAALVALACLQLFKCTRSIPPDVEAVVDRVAAFCFVVAFVWPVPFPHPTIRVRGRLLVFSCRIELGIRFSRREVRAARPRCSMFFVFSLFLTTHSHLLHVRVRPCTLKPEYRSMTLYSLCSDLRSRLSPVWRAAPSRL
jgi:hypothetical protein